MIRFLLFGFLFTLLLLVMGCKKEQTDNPSNPIVKYNPIGKYKVIQHISSSGTWPDTNSFIDTFLSVTHGKTDTTYFFLGREIFLDESGYYQWTHFFSCRLWNDSLISNYAGINNTGAIFISYEGVRISKIP